MAESQPPPAAQGSSQVSDLERRVADIAKQLKEVDALQSKSKKQRWIAVLLVIAIVVFYVYLIYHAFASIDMQKLAQATQDSLVPSVENLKPTAKRVAGKTWNHLRPVIEQKLQERIPRLRTKFEKEVNILAKNLQVKIKERIADQLEALEEDVRKELMRQIPEAKDKEKIALFITHYEEAMADSLQEIYVEFMVEHEQLLTKIERTIEELEKPISLPSEKRLIPELEKTLQKLLELKYERLRELFIFSEVE